jgi:hypothetical protein
LQAAKRVTTSPFLAEKIVLSVHTGLRRGSLFCLRWDQVDFLNRVLRIPRTKSGRPHAVPLNATVLTTLQALYNQRIIDCAYVFAHATGRKAGEPVRDVKNAFQTAMETAEIKDGALAAAELDAMHDAGVDLSSHMDLAKAVRPGRAVQRVNVDFPVDLLREIDQEARRLGVTRQAFIKVRLADSLAKNH